jgi:hypothetical protein
MSWAIACDGRIWECQSFLQLIDAGQVLATRRAKELSSAFDLPLWMQPKGETAGAEWLANGVFEKMNPLMLFNSVLDPALVFIGEDLSGGPLVRVEIPVAFAEDFGSCFAFDWEVPSPFLGWQCFGYRKGREVGR